MNTNNAVLTVLIAGLAIFGLIVLARGYGQNLNDQTSSVPTITPEVTTNSEFISPNPSITRTTSPTSKLSPSSRPSVTQNQSANQSSMQISLNSVNDTYGQSGTAVLSESNGKTKVSITVNAVPDLTLPEPVHIHMGTCDNPGNIVYSLNNIINGQSATTLDTTLNNIRSKEPLVINIHKSNQEINVHTACGNLRK
jgi:hypothetical protein